jgi:uncharacterized protein (TIGR02598 family)
LLEGYGFGDESGNDGAKKLLTISTQSTNCIDMNSKISLFNRTRRSAVSRGFSLIEVCLCLGVLTFAILPLLGLMAGGLGLMRMNMDRNQAASISQQILLEAQQMDFTTLLNKGTYSEYFTADGDQVNKGSPLIVYTANITVYNPTSKSAPLQGGAGTSPGTLAALSIQVRKTPGGIDAATNPPVATFVNMVSCNDLSALTSENAGN